VNDLLMMIKFAMCLGWYRHAKWAGTTGYRGTGSQATNSLGLLAEQAITTIDGGSIDG